MKEPSLRCQRRDGPLLEKREKWGTPVSDWSELRDEPHNHRTLGEGGHPPSLNRLQQSLSHAFPEVSGSNKKDQLAWFCLFPKFSTFVG